MKPQSAGDAGSPIAKPQSIRLATFLTRLIWLSILPLLLLSGWQAFEHVTSRREELDLEAATQAKSLAATVDQHLTARIAALNVLAHSPLLDETATHQAFYREAQGFRNNFGSHVVLAALDMQMLLNTRQPFGTAPCPNCRGRADGLLPPSRWRPAGPQSGTPSSDRSPRKHW
ncbi:hypothetical protein [Dechloromonas sp. A34]|uniref:hypothetical protein n=1 Tax=Dechloromonas sp. A34 TaxID=447588 RepID=UPI002249906D|nr:hypothetical protein [Dechloromonas sp. A34]